MMRVTFQPTMDDLIDLHLVATWRRRRRLGRVRVNSRPRRSMLLLYLVLVGLTIAVGLAGTQFIDSVLSTLKSIVLSLIPTAIGVVVVLVALYVWLRLTSRQRYRSVLAGSAARLDRAGPLSVIVSETGVETTDALSYFRAFWSGVDEVLDTGQAVLILIGTMVVRCPQRAFASPEEAREFAQLASRYFSEANAADASRAEQPPAD